MRKLRQRMKISISKPNEEIKISTSFSGNDVSSGDKGYDSSKPAVSYDNMSFADGSRSGSINRGPATIVVAKTEVDTQNSCTIEDFSKPQYDHESNKGSFVIE